MILNGPKVVVTNSVIAGNYGFGGIGIDSDDGASTTSVTVTDSNLSHNGSGAIIALATNAGSIVRLALARNTISGNMYTGVELTANTGTGNAITTNSTFGVRQATTALVRTRANNVIQDNGTDISGTLTVVSGD